MKVSKIPFNMNFSENEDLIEVVEDLKSMKHGVNYLLDELETENDDLSKASIHSLLGIYNRLIGSFDQSLFYLKEALKTFESKDRPALIYVTKLRMALTYSKINKTKESEEIIKSLIRISEETNNKELKSLKDKALLTKGKIQFYQKEYKGALEVFLKIMDLRIVEGDLTKVDQITQIIKKVRSKI